MYAIRSYYVVEAVRQDLDRDVFALEQNPGGCQKRDPQQGILIKLYHPDRIGQVCLPHENGIADGKGDKQEEQTRYQRQLV